MVAMGGMAGMLCLFAIRRAAIWVRFAGVSTFAQAAESPGKGPIATVHGGRSWLFLCRLGLRLRLSMAVGWTLLLLGSGRLLLMAGVGGMGTSGFPLLSGRRHGLPSRGPRVKRGGSRFG